MFGFFKKKVKKEKCNHKWHHLQDTYICVNHMSDTEDACYIFCSKCELEIMVSPEKWERIEKRQKIMEVEKPAYKFAIKVLDSRSGDDRVIVVRGHYVNETNKGTVIVDGVEISFGLFEYVESINTYPVD